MKIRFFAFLLAALTLLSLCACASEDNTANGYGEIPGNPEETSAEESLWMKDIDYLGEQGYSASLTRSGLYQFEDVIKAEKNSIQAIVTATKEAEGKVIVIYYLKTEEQAASCMEKLASPFKQVGIRIVHGDQDGVIR